MTVRWAILGVIVITAQLVGGSASASAGDDGVGPRIQSVAAGGSHSCALTEAGDVWCWGANSVGQLGSGDLTLAEPYGRPSAGRVVGLRQTAAFLAAGANHTCALTVKGALRCWGFNLYGQVGDGTSGETNFRSSPADVVDLGLNTVAVGAGDYHTCAIDEGHRARCWGLNDVGQLGTGEMTGRVPHSRPSEVTGLQADVVAISAGGAHTCALDQDGTVWCWGSNSHGQLGDGTTTDRSSPSEVRLDTEAVAVSAGGEHTCALTTAGGVKCWGRNDAGQLGDGTTDDRSLPEDVVGHTGGVIGIAAGHSHTCVLTKNGRVQCWGSNGWGRLGNASIELDSFSSVPVDVGGLDAVSAVSAGGEHSCAVVADGSVWCWGKDFAGQLGDGNAGLGKFSAAPVRVRFAALEPSPTPGVSRLRLVTLGDSILAGCCQDRSRGAAALFNRFVSREYGEPVALFNLATDNASSDGLVLDPHIWTWSQRATTQIDEAVILLRESEAEGDDVLAIALQIGGNDFLELRDPGTGTLCYQGPTETCAALFADALAAFRSNLRRTIGDLTRNKQLDTPVIILNYYNPFDTGADTPLIRVAEAAVGAINAIIAEMAAERGAHLVDIHSRFAGKASTLVSGTDPTLEGHGVIADAMADVYVSLRAKAPEVPSALPKTGLSYSDRDAGWVWPVAALAVLLGILAWAILSTAASARR